MTSDGRIREGYVEEIAFELGFVQVVFGLSREGKAPLGKEHVAKAWLWEGVWLHKGPKNSVPWMELRECQEV